MRAGGCAEEVALHDLGLGGVDEEGLVDAEGGDVPGVVLEHGLDEGVVDVLVADGVAEDVDAVVDEDAGVGEVVLVGGYVEVIVVGLFDDGGVDGGGHGGDFAVGGIDPDFDDVGVFGGEVLNYGAGFFGGGGAVDLVGSGGEAGVAVGDADAAAGGEEGGSAEVAGALLGADVVAEVAADAEGEDAGDAVALELVEVSGDVLVGVGGGGALGEVDEHAYVGVGADEAGDDGLAGAVYCAFWRGEALRVH